MNYPRRPSEKESKVTHVSTCTLRGNGLPPFPLDPKPGAKRHRWLI